MQTLLHWLSNPSFRALALSLLASLWQAGLIFLVIYSLLLLNKNAPARIKYNIAALGQLIVACWFVQTFLHHLSLQNSMSSSLTGSEAAMLFYPGRFPIFSGMYPEAPGSTGFQLSRFIPLAVFVYFLGVVIMAVRIIFAYGQTRMLKTRGLFTVPEGYTRHLKQICAQLNIYSHVRLYLSNRVRVPVMMGFIKPVILLPVTIATHLTAEQIEAIITHEVAHIRRQDYLVNFLQTIVEALFFFNPFVWLLSKVMREERENACDELVVREVPAYTYATALLALEKINGTKQLTLAANGHKSFKLLNRIKLFTMKQNPIMTIKQKALSLLLIVIGLSCLAWLSPEKAGKQTKGQSPASGQTASAAWSAQPRTTASVTDTTPRRQRSATTSRESLSPAIQQQIDEIARSAGQIAEKMAGDTSWKENMKAIQIKAEKLALKFEQDSSWKKSVARMTRDAEVLASKIKEDPELKRQLQTIEKQAQEMSGKYQPTPEMQKQLEDIRNKSLDIALRFKNDTAWKKQLKTIRFKAQELARRMKEDPELAKKIRDMAEKSKDIAFKVINDPGFKAQLEKLQSDMQKLKWTDDNSEE